MAQPDRLLEGEDPATIYRQDARHWIAVYRQMISFKDELLRRMRAQAGTLPAAGRRDVMENDVAIIEKQLTRYQRRIEFWFARQWELEGLSIDEGERTIAYRDRSIHLTRREYQLFSTLADGSPAFTSAGKLLAEAWHNTRLPEETVRTYIVRLRRKLAALGGAIRWFSKTKRARTVSARRPEVQLREVLSHSGCFWKRPPQPM